MSLKTLFSLSLLIFFGIANLAFANEMETQNSTESENATPAHEIRVAQTPQNSGQTDEIETLRQQIEVLAEEVEKLRSGEVEGETGEALSDEKIQALGLGPAASSIYRKNKGVSMAGYGEMLYENFADQNESDKATDKASQLDFLRAIVYFGYRFDKRFVFNSEIEFEHASTDKEGSVSAEFAYLDYMAFPWLTVRGGLLLIPMGLTNEFHEPNVFLGTKRPETERQILPSTWRENGFGFLGSFGPLHYRLYLVNGMDATGFTPGGLRDGRQSGSKAKASDLAGVARLDVAPIPGVLAGGSIYYGGADQGQILDAAENSVDVNTLIYEAHAQVQMYGMDIRGLFAAANVDHVKELNDVIEGLEEGESVGETLVGTYLQVAYNVFSLFPQWQMALSPYFRYETLDTQNKVPQGFSQDKSQQKDIFTFGLEFKPIYHVVLKTDYQIIQNEAQSGVDQFNIALGYSF